MVTGRPDSRDRGLTEWTGVAVLLGFTILVTASVGLNVFIQTGLETGPPDANFSYDYQSESSSLLITHEEGDEFRAGELVVVGPSTEANWSALANAGENETVGPGDAVQISQQNEYGRTVSLSDTVRIYYESDGNRSELSSWSGSSTRDPFASLGGPRSDGDSGPPPGGEGLFGSATARPVRPASP